MNGLKIGTYVALTLLCVFVSASVHTGAVQVIFLLLAAMYAVSAVYYTQRGGE